MISRRKFGALSAAAASTLAFPMIARAKDENVLRISWTNTVSVGAQMVHTLKNTDIAESNGVKLELIQLSNTPAISESVVTGASDIGIVSDFGAVTLMAAGVPVVPFAHQCSFRSAILATPNSGIKTMADLKGKKIYGLFGITAYQNAQEAVRKAGLVVGKDVQFVNIATTELSDAVRAQKIDAFFIWDPWVAMFEKSGLGHVLSQNMSPSMVAQAHTRTLDKRPDVVKSFLRAQSQALLFAANNHDLTNGWFRSMEPAKNIPADVIQAASNFDPHWNSKKLSDIKCELTPKALATMDKMGEWGVAEKLLPKAPKASQLANTALAKAVDAELEVSSFNLKTVKVKG
jgi:sulfonate transport system substrate-binding protein